MLYTVITIFISLILFLVPLVISKKNMFNKNKCSIFECGFDPKNLSRLPFSLKFFKLCLIFIIFDIEIIVILPSPLIISKNIMFLSMFSILLLIFFLSLIFEWYQNSLNWM